MGYSNRHLKDMPSPKEYVIKSLSAYMKLFSSGKFSNYIYRGEPTNYLETISSALRAKEYPFIQMKNEFKREVYHRLTTEEKRDFLAFSQHYGLPTNLIDFTRSPLIALYFACQPFVSKDERFDSERGFVCLLPNDLIDITDLITGHEDDNFLLRFIRNEEDVLIKLYDRIAVYEKLHPRKFYFYFKALTDDWHYYFVDGFPAKKKRSRFPAYNDGEYEFRIKQTFSIEYSEDAVAITNRFGDVSLTVLEYVLMLREFLKKTIEYKATVWWLNCMPNFLYAPCLTFGRARNQQGLFVYQAYLSFDDEMLGTHIVSQQRVWPEYILVIENKEEILRELDFIGINDKFIYDDFDRIAAYIKQKYEKKSNQ